MSEFTCTENSCGNRERNDNPTMIASPVGPRPICIACAAKRQMFTCSPKQESIAAPFQKSDTSRAAAKALDGTGKAARDRRKIIAHMQAHPSKAFKRTDFIAPLGIVNQALCARLNELESGGHIFRSHKVKGIHGARVWTYKLRTREAAA